MMRERKSEEGNAMVFRTTWWSDTTVIVQVPTDIAKPVHVAKYLEAMIPGASMKIGIDTVTVQKPYPDVTLKHETALVLAQYQPKKSYTPIGKMFDITVIYNGEDISSIAGKLGVAETELIARHQRTVWEVAMIGFAPGFPYLLPASEEDKPFWQNIPRLSTPRAVTPAGSVAVAAGMCAIYPNNMPGGWQILGVATLQLFDENRDTPALLKAGDIVRFNPRGIE